MHHGLFPQLNYGRRRPTDLLQEALLCLMNTDPEIRAQLKFALFASLRTDLLKSYGSV